MPTHSQQEGEKCCDKCGSIMTSGEYFDLVETAHCSNSQCPCHTPTTSEDVWEKCCTQCKEFKPLNEFYRKHTSSDGYNYFCKKCYLKYDTARYYNNRRNRLDSQKGRYQRKKDSFRDSKERQRILYPEKDKARKVLRNALLRGRIKQLPCSECGDIKSQAHHPDYLKPLEVNWLCRSHHMKLHRKYEEYPTTK